MKTAISVPDRLFDAAERMSRKLGISRSRLYALAVEAYLKSHRTHRVKEALNAAYQSEASEMDPALRAMQDASVSQRV